MKIQLGTWLSSGSPVIAELAALSGFDWLLLDLEHGCGTEATIFPLLLATRGTGAQAIVRVGAPYRDLISRLLDWGSHGIMVPHVNTGDDATQIVRATRYSPGGTRGYSGTVRANHFGLCPIEEVLPPLIMAQIESIEGVKNAAEIAAVDGIDVLFIGPADLRHDLTHRAEYAPGDFDDCLSQVIQATRNAGKHAGILLRDLGDLPKYRDLGFTHIAVDSDLAILRKSYQQTRGAVP